jgi:hypothetical protein
VLEEKLALQHLNYVGMCSKYVGPRARIFRGTDAGYNLN